MFRLAMHDYLHGFKRNIITVVQLVFIFTLIVILSSTLFAQTGLYNLFCDRETNVKGVLMSQVSEDVLSIMSEVEEAIYAKTTFLEAKKESKKIGILDINVYNENMSKYIEPVVEEGVWVDSIFANNKYPCFTIFPNKLGIKSGDILTVYDYEGKEFKIYISGVLAPEQYIYEGNTARTLNPKEMDYTVLVNKEPDEDNTDHLILVTTEKEMKKLGGSIYYTCGNGVIKYSDSISEEEIENNNDLVRDYIAESTGMSSGGIKLCSLQEFYDNSLKRVNAVMITYIPIMVVAVILILSSILGYEYICHQRLIRRYSVYYMLGTRWKMISVIATVRNVINFLISYAIIYGIYYLAEIFNLKKYLFVSFTENQQQLLLLIGCIFVVFGAVIPYRLFRKVTPDDVIRSAKMS